MDWLEKTTIYLPADIRRQIRVMALQRRVSQAEIIREALRTFLTAQGQPRPRSLGVARSKEIAGQTARDWLRENWHSR